MQLASFAVYMDGDPELGRKYLSEIEMKIKPDLVFVVGIWALQVAASRPLAIPVVYSMVLNPPSIVNPSTKNITGASMAALVAIALVLGSAVRVPTESSRRRSRWT